jgi:hypothetical protein
MPRLPNPRWDHLGWWDWTYGEGEGEPPVIQVDEPAEPACLLDKDGKPIPSTRPRFGF